MSEGYAAVVDRARAWFERAAQAGWLTQFELERFTRLEHHTPGDLFADQQQRPLVVAFFGGTGVGKSSLLNRLAGENIARTGVERPTSRDVTIYVHESIKLADLPPELPLEHVRIQKHGRADGRDVLWIDAPDIDSAAEENRKLALAWLPHVDLLIYVVSPERYRDDVGWRVLQQRGERHGWMFVLNRWDEGDARQKNDFVTMLQAAGFEQPLLFSTSCLTQPVALPSPDEFDKIEAAIRSYLDAHGVRELERLGHRARLLEMRGVLTEALRRFGDDTQWTEIAAASERHWQHASFALSQGLEWPIREIAGRFAVREGNVMRQAVRAVMSAAAESRDSDRDPPNPAHTPAKTGAQRNPASDLDVVQLTQPLWDDWTQDKVGECLDALEVDVRRLNLAARPIRDALESYREQAGPLTLSYMQEHLRLSMAQPGTRIQRALRRVTGFLMTFLPMLSLLWVAYNVVRGYYHASTGGGSYLGSDFAVNSVLLVLVSWAVPYGCDRALRPSLERAASRALRKGLQAGLKRLDAELRENLAATRDKARAEMAEATEILKQIAHLVLQPVNAKDNTLLRLLKTPRRDAASAG